MNQITSSDYIELMQRWLRVLPEFLRVSVFNKNLQYYGTGESTSWPMQSNCNVFAALAVMATSPKVDESTHHNCLDTALALLRYSLRTHITGSEFASDGRQWGCHWMSALGLERMTHGVNAIRNFLTEEDRNNLRRLRITESDWLLDEYEVLADMYGHSGRNHPESNIWNGGMLLRTAYDYPDAPRRDEYMEKATSFLINGISHPLDAESEVCFRSRPVRQWHIGANFTSHFSLDHHGYLNVGYMVICLSNIAMLHFNFKQLGQKPPEELYWHVEDLWRVVKHFTFNDGRLLRIGGDTRARYAYCQNYTIPVWMMMAEKYGDRDAVAFERNWLKLVKKEMDYSGDGGFYSRRLAQLRDVNYFYYTRLESDAILSLSYGALWRHKFDIPAEGSAPAKNPPAVWQEHFHGANMLRENSSVRSWVWRGAQGPTGICVPAEHSNMAEWQSNLHGELLSTQTPSMNIAFTGSSRFEGGFLSSGCCKWQDVAPLGEGEGQYFYASQQTVAAALPDGCSMLILEYAKITKEVTLRQIKGLNLKIPNDLFNDSVRCYRGENFNEKLAGNPGKDDTRVVHSKWLTIDGLVGVFNIYGSDSLTIYRPSKPSILIQKTHGPWLHSLYADEICSQAVFETRRYMPGEVVLDCGCGVSAGTTRCESRRLDQPGELRGVEFIAANGKKYALIANFGNDGEFPELRGKLLASIDNYARLLEMI